MAKLNDTQLVILSAASRRRDFSVYPLPRSVKRGDGPKVLKHLLAKGLIEETEAVGDAPVWRQHEDGYGVTLILADGGFKALGVAREVAEPEVSPKEAEKKSATVPAIKSGSKLEKAVAMLKSKDGASIDEIATSLDWLPHTARAVLSVSVKRKLGLKLESQRDDSRGRVYRVC
jgi:hypothetical protein